ncbi:hypothetical protein C1H46_045189 [Malus baccata]|uniref:Uncharacterized protein n=1 Tax=Malus baccata TaxID=106549 RepID=A0A540K4X1_MALBA|nr:hypothetical protein C1H46_045189 [Malus baccata]
MRLKKLVEGKTLVKVPQILERSMKRSLLHIRKVAQRKRIESYQLLQLGEIA